MTWMHPERTEEKPGERARVGVAGGRHAGIFDFVKEHPDVFPGFFLPDVEGNIRPKFRVLQAHGFYRATTRLLGESDSCGAHSPGVPPEAGPVRMGRPRTQRAGPR